MLLPPVTPQRKLSRPAGELDLIENLRSTFSKGSRRPGLTLGIGDDCAILRPPAGSEILVTTDFTLEGRHFRRDLHPASAVGHRCLARGLSDLAAMGATPLAAFLSLALPSSLLRQASGRRWLQGFLAGMYALSAQAKVPLAGGDTAEAPGEHIAADIVLVGSAPAGTALRRSAAKPGDTLYVTGTLGGASAELSAMLTSGKPPRDKTTRDHPHLFPQPRLKTGDRLRRTPGIGACIDLSDGLSTDLTHLCRSSNVRAEITLADLPAHVLTHNLDSPAAIAATLHGGEDYELLFTVRSSAKLPAKLTGVPITPIGRILARRSRAPLVSLRLPSGAIEDLQPGGWEHFSRS